MVATAGVCTPSRLATAKRAVELVRAAQLLPPPWRAVSGNHVASGAVDANELAYFSDQVAAGKVILVTGAGFSLQAQAEDGQKVPSATQLLHELWPIVYGSAGYDG